MIYSKISVEMLHGRLGSPPGRLGRAERPATRATREPSGLRGALPQRTLARPPRCWAEAAAAHVPAGAGGHMTYARVRARRAHERARGGRGKGAGGGVRSPEAAARLGSGRRDAAAVRLCRVPIHVRSFWPLRPRKAIVERTGGDSLGLDWTSDVALLHVASVEFTVLLSPRA